MSDANGPPCARAIKYRPKPVSATPTCHASPAGGEAPSRGQTRSCRHCTLQPRWLRHRSRPTPESRFGRHDGSMSQCFRHRRRRVSAVVVVAPRGSARTCTACRLWTCSLHSCGCVCMRCSCCLAAAAAAGSRSRDACCETAVNCAPARDASWHGIVKTRRIGRYASTPSRVRCFHSQLTAASLGLRFLPVPPASSPQMQLQAATLGPYTHIRPRSIAVSFSAAARARLRASRDVTYAVCVLDAAAFRAYYSESARGICPYTCASRASPNARDARAASVFRSMGGYSECISFWRMSHDAP